MTLVLKTPTINDKANVLAYLNEHYQNNEYALNGCAQLHQYETYEQWLADIHYKNEVPLSDSKNIPSSTFLVIQKKDHKLVGMCTIRHKLNAFLLTSSGNIGYGVRPSERRRGYAKQILKLSLDFAKSIGLKKVMISCYATNIASRKTIEHAGGILSKKAPYPDGKLSYFYWIYLSSE